MKFKVHSLRIEKIRTYNDRENQYEDNEVYVLNCFTDKKDKVEIRLWETYGDCYSGYCPASFAYLRIIQCDQFVGYTHKPIKELEFEIDNKDIDKYVNNNLYELSNDIFKYYDDSDDWYPSGYVEINEDLFTPIIRNKEKRPVWIFKGDSGLGKSYLAGIINNCEFEGLSVYETDDHEELDEINTNLIVIGNKYNYSVEDVEKHIAGEHEIIVVDFSKYIKENDND